MANSEMPTYTEVNQILNRIRNTSSAASAAEMHGMICGFICAGTEMNGKSFFALMPGKPNLEQQALQQYRQLVLRLYESSQQKLQSMDFDFYLLLPDDEEDLSMRSQALTDWCRGFVSAIEHSGLSLAEYVSSDCHEATQYIQDIAQLDYQQMEVCREEEEAYIELVEYIRVVVLMIYTEIITTQQGGYQNDSKNLH